MYLLRAELGADRGFGDSQVVVVFIATEVCLYVYSKLPMGNLFLLLLIRLVALYTRLSVAVNGLYNGKSQCFRCLVISLARGLPGPKSRKASERCVTSATKRLTSRTSFTRT